MRNLCESVKGEFKSQNVLELHRGRQSSCVHSISDFVKKTDERDFEDSEKVSSLVSLRFIQQLLNKAQIKKHRTSFCCNRQFSVCSSTRLLDNGKTTNIYHCNHNSCAVCSKKIYKDKNREIRKAFKYVKRNNREASFHIMTLTISHKKEDLLEDRIRTISDMKRKLMNHKVIKDLDLLFYHSTLEIVYGRSGWHAHYHIMLTKNGSLTESESDAIGNQWQKIGKKLNVAVDLKKGFHIGSTDCLDAAATYLSKSEELKSLGKKLASELVSDNKTYKNNESYAIQQLIGLAAAGRWNEIAYSKFKVEELILEYLQIKNINYFRGCRKWNQIVKDSKDEKIDDDNKEKNVKKFIDISSRAYIELLKHDLLLGSEKKDKEGNIKEFEGILKEHRKNEDIEDTYGYILWVLEKKEKDLYIGIQNDIKRVVVVDENDLEQDLSFSDRRTVLRFSLDSFETERAIAA
jgi:hypothetical protein